VTVGPKVSDKRFKDALDLHDNYIWGLSMRLFGTGSDARGCLVAIPKVESKELELELELVRYKLACCAEGGMYSMSGIKCRAAMSFDVSGNCTKYARLPSPPSYLVCVCVLVCVSVSVHVHV